MEKEEEDIKKCCICGKTFVGQGANPWPYEDFSDVNSVCCEDCYKKDVLPALSALGSLFKYY